jgi:hypothetical protein
MDMEIYKYTWKIGLEYSSNRELETNKPIVEGMIFADLFDGIRYRVSHVFTAKPMDRVTNQMPDTVIQTWPAGNLAEQELADLRVRANYKPGPSPRRYEAIAF